MAALTRQWGDVAFAPPAAVNGDLITLPPDEAHHVFRVLRKRQGDHLSVVDGKGTLHKCVVESAGVLRVLGTVYNAGESEHAVRLWCAVLKGDASRDVIDVATQLGVLSVDLFQADRSQEQLTTDKLKKLERVALSAMKQCGRSVLPRISCSASLKDLLIQSKSATNYCLVHPLHNPDPPSQRHSFNEPTTVIVGPEGGLTDPEVRLVMNSSPFVLDLGSRRLRAVVAVAAALSHIHSVRKEFGISAS